MRTHLICSMLYIALCACADVVPVPAPGSGPIGGPLAGLTPEQLARFEAGALHFRHVYTTDEGVGPRFNENACNACHTDPADGGTGEQLVTKASRVSDLGICDPLTEMGGPNLRRLVTPAAAASGATAVPIPASSTNAGRFTTPFLFGLGMVEAIDVATLAALADPDDLNGDGISGRMGRDAQGRPARFGRKANVATLADFIDEAFRLEMGLTTPGHTDESAAGGVPAVAPEADLVDDPEVDAATLAATVDFVRFLAPLAPADQGSSAVTRGAELFQSLGCTACHVPDLPTGESDVEALSNESIALFSDLLLHDMGAELAGPCTSGAEPTEFRTEPLMGLRHRIIFLHDGRAGRVRDAILLHGGEALAARDRFNDLDRVTQEALIAYLGTL